jgi:endonuclease G
MAPESSYITLRNIGYVSGYSEKRRNPVWVSYRVFRSPNAIPLIRPKGDFITDTRTIAKVSHHDYTGSGYDRGHMAPNSAIATRYGADAQRETFLLSNICPQAPNLNQKVWERLERAEVEYADRYEEVWVIDGPIFPDVNGGTEKKLRSGISVPSSFYKILVDEQLGKPRVFAVIMPQTVKGTESPDQFRTSVREIEKQSRLDFLTDLDPAVQKELEEKVWPMW